MPLGDITMSAGSWTEHELNEWYPATLIRVEDAGDYGYGPTLRFVVAIDGEDEETWALCSDKLVPRSKLYSWVTGIDPTNLPDEGQQWDHRPLEGRRVEVMFEQGTSRIGIGKIRAEKKKGDKTALQQKQAQATAAKKPPARDTTEFGPDEAPF